MDVVSSVVNAELDAGPLVPVVIVHGTGGNARDAHDDWRPVVGRHLRRAAWVVAPQFGTPYQFLLPDADRRLIDVLDAPGDRTGGRAVGPRCLIYGMSGGGQFGHRFAERHPGRVIACAALAAGAWTAPDGTLFGMMVDDGWFAREGWDDPAVERAGRVPAADGWRGVRWLVGCGTRDLPSRVSSAGRFRDVLRSGGAAVEWLEWEGGHETPPGEVSDAVGRFFAASLDAGATGP